MSEPEAQKPSGDVVDDLQLFADMVTPYSDLPISHFARIRSARKQKQILRAAIKEIVALRKAQTAKRPWYA